MVALSCLWPILSFGQASGDQVELTKLDALIEQLETAIASKGDFPIGSASESLLDPSDQQGAIVPPLPNEALPSCLSDVGVDGLDARIDVIDETAAALNGLVGLHAQTTELLSISACEAGAMPTVQLMSVRLGEIDLEDAVNVLVLTENCAPSMGDTALFLNRRSALLESYRAYLLASSAATQVVEECGL